MKIRLVKLKELEDALHPNNIPEGFDKTFEVNEAQFEPPHLDERFWVGSFSTSGVQEIISENTFRTYSSIYKWEIVEETPFN